jgi:exopolysaccharide biosynthesis polyprenyl glycosylphosphotransferase
MIHKNLPAISQKSDLRSARGTKLQRGSLIRFVRVLTLVSFDVIALSLAWNMALLSGTFLYSPWTQNKYFLLLILAVGIGTIATKGLYKSGLYRRNYLSLINAVSLSNIFLLIIAFLYEPDGYLSRSSFIFFWLFSVVFICCDRILFDIGTKILRHKGIIRHSAFLITDLKEKEKYTEIIEEQDCYRVVGATDSSCLDLNNRETTIEYLRQQGIEEAFVSWSSIKNRLYVCWNFQTAGVMLRILPSLSEFSHPKSEMTMVGKIPCMTIPAPIIAGSDFWLKRCFDLCCAIVLLVFLSPVMVAIAILIRLDSPGPIFFRQKRVGLHSKSFQIWKFRTMVNDAEKLQASLEAKNEIKDGVLFKMKNDPRITKLGKFLRLYSLDELPQIFNVLFGEMSLVGPRPLPIRDVDKFQRKHFIRQEVLPGITGLWQVSGRSDIENFEEGVKLDLFYIENWSLWLDLKILISTIRVVLQKSGAY